MGTARREKGVLKLIHPGKHVEVYRNPIPAAEVLDKYPRYCITRPDVFKHPWIVVNPDSILVPGKVFLLVPKRTIYGLMKSRLQHDLPLPPHHRRIRHPIPSPSKSNAGMTPKHKTHNYRSSKAPEQAPARRRSRKSSQIESWPQVICNNKSVKYSNAHDCYGCSELPPRKKVENRRQEMVLKSCMRKPDSGRRLVNPKVRFSIPGEDVEPKQRTIMESLSKFAASLLIVDMCR